MTFNEYQTEARQTAQYPNLGENLLYPSLGLSGETGEVVDKIKKLWRNKGITDGSKLSVEDKFALVKELGDVLWYVAALANELDVSLERVAWLNIEKLWDRSERGVIKSEGDTR